MVFLIAVKNDTSRKVANHLNNLGAFDFTDSVWLYQYRDGECDAEQMKENVLRYANLEKDAVIVVDLSQTPLSFHPSALRQFLS